jgi:hypothetical protein
VPELNGCCFVSGDVHLIKSSLLGVMENQFEEAKVIDIIELTHVPVPLF